MSAAVGRRAEQRVVLTPDSELRPALRAALVEIERLSALRYPQGEHFSGYEVLPVHVLSGECQAFDALDEALALQGLQGGEVIWSLYGRRQEHGPHRPAECIGDFGDERGALTIYSLITGCPPPPARGRAHFELPRAPPL